MARRHGRFMLAALALVFMLAACAPAAVSPTVTPVPTVAPTITPDAAQPLVLVLPSLYEQKTLIAANRHYSDAVKRKGWNVEFYTVQSNDADGKDCYLPYVNKQLCSGTARADGFVCMQYLSSPDEDPLLEAKVNGQLYDCVSAAPQVVPQYWAKYQAQIITGKYGLVLAGRQTPARINDLVLVVRNDVLPLAGKGLYGYDGLRALIAQLEQTHLKKAYVQAYTQQLLSIWTKQQGYLELFSDAGIYARIDDPDAKPVMLEDIPGFTAFFQDMIGMIAQRLFQNLPYPDTNITSNNTSLDGEEPLGPAAALDYTYNLLYYTGAGNVPWKGYTAFPLAGDSPNADSISEAVRTSSLSRTGFLRELIIPARSRRAADAMAFIQWLYADRRNADTVIYGQEGEDYALQGERVALIGNSTSQVTQNAPSSQNWPGQYLFQLAAERRIYANAPDNAEALLGDKPSRPLAAPWLAHIASGEAWNKLMFRDSMDSRQNAIQTLWDLMQNPSSSMGSVDSYIKLLRAGATDSILQPYLDVLAEARAAAQP